MSSPNLLRVLDDIPHLTYFSDKNPRDILTIVLSRGSISVIADFRNRICDSTD